MDALRYSLFAPSTTTVMLVYGIVDALLTMTGERYKCKDDNGKPLLSIPYEPWNAPTDPKYKGSTDKAYRAFKMFENVKEWNFMALPPMWVFAVYGGSLPFLTDGMMDGVVLVSGAVYAVATRMFMSGYMDSPEKRLSGFKLRRKVFEFWLFGSAVSLAWSGLGRYGIVGKDGWMKV